ncbi:hypothetical protein [Paraglaciecola arctica]|uniref:hypothetical protein n=1 Tax=Paraglaciecola arctica TaxID=1128911 RepID=UPI001C07C7F5|nr:hypothetical protein [Paraglaciecola arctica]MBU3004764.1 hypothetical protein [Paraglaciecola arctica]
MKHLVRQIGRYKIPLNWTLLILAISTLPLTYAGPREQAKRIHDRLTGIPPSIQVLDEMESLISEGKIQEAAAIAMQNPAFYSITLKNWITPWTNEEADVFAPLNDYTATIIGMVRDDIDFRQILSGDILYVANSNSGIPAYSMTSNAHYQALEEQSADLQDILQRTTQSEETGLPEQATAGVMTTRAAAKSFFKDGTNRAMFRFTLINHLCTDLEGLKDTSRSPDRIRQDVSRSPGGDSRIFNNSCVGCHAGMDPLAQAFAYYNYEYNVESDPQGEQGTLQYNHVGQVDPDTGSQVQAKYHINGNNFPYGFFTNNDDWSNYWRQGLNKNLGWDTSLPGSGSGAKSMGQELANSQRFANCQVTKVFKNVCLRSPQDAADRAKITNITNTFTSTGYNIKQVFADSADYCKGE